ncbi:MAG: type I restriction enzyme M protein [Flavobacteriaceae bacterium]
MYRGDNTLFNKLVANYKANDNTDELEWLTSRFPSAEYVDILGLCKVVNRTEIADNDYSLTPGRYVGVEDQIDHDFDYETEMGSIKEELKELNADANVLAAQIQTNLEELGL